MKVSYTIKDEEKEIILKPSEDGWKVVWEGWEDITPMFNYVLIEKDEEKTKSNGGIIIPDNMKEKPSTGTVVAIGDGLWDEKTSSFRPMRVKVGDRVLFPKQAGQTVIVGDKQKTLIKEDTLLGILK